MTSRSNLVKDYFQILIKPRETIERIDEKAQDLLKSLIVVALSGIIFLLGIFIVGGTVYFIFYEQYSTFILEQLTSGMLFGYSISRYDVIFVFFGGFIFIIKSWLLFSILFYLFMRIFGEKQNLKMILNRFAWSIYPYAILTFCLAIICLLLKFILPMYYHYLFYGGLGALFIVLIPITLQRFYDKDTEHALPLKLFLSYYLILFVMILLWFYNHYSIILAGFF